MERAMLSVVTSERPPSRTTRSCTCTSSCHDTGIDGSLVLPGTCDCNQINANMFIIITMLQCPIYNNRETNSAFNGVAMSKSAVGKKRVFRALRKATAESTLDGKMTKCHISTTQCIFRLFLSILMILQFVSKQ